MGFLCCHLSSYSFSRKIKLHWSGEGAEYFYFLLFEVLPSLPARRNPSRIPLWRLCQPAYARWKPHPPQSCTMCCDGKKKKLRLWPSSCFATGHWLKKPNVSQRTLCSSQWLDLLYFCSICVSAWHQGSERDIDVQQITVFCQNGHLPECKRSACSLEVHFGLQIRLCEAGWLRTVFAVVIGDVGVIIEDLEEQRSYFGVIDFFWLPLAMLDKWGRNFNPPNRRVIELLQHQQHTHFWVYSIRILFQLTPVAFIAPLTVFCCQLNLHVMHLVPSLTEYKNHMLLSNLRLPVQSFAKGSSNFSSWSDPS